MKKTTRNLLTGVAVAVVLIGAGAFAFRGRLGNGWRNDQKPAEAKPDQDSPFTVKGDTIEVPDEAVKSAGIATMEVKREALPVTLWLSGKTGLDMELVAHVHAQFPGKVVQVGPQLGDAVKGPADPGGPTRLCVIESTDLAGAKSDYLKAQVQLKLDQENLTRTQELVRSTVLAEKYLLDAQSAITKDGADVEAARQKLKVFGLSDAEIEAAAKQQGRERMDYVIFSPRSGQVAEKGVSGGEVADPTVNLFTVADTSRLWIWGDVYERDRRKLKEGQKVVVYLTSAPDQPHETTIDWISPVLDANTRSIRIRGALDNKDGRMLAEMYATLGVTVDEGRDSIVVPADAVVRRKADAFVFVRARADKDAVTFRRRPVKVEPVDAGPGLSDSPPAASANDPGGPAQPPPQRLRVVEGLEPGETVVRSGALGLFNEMETQGK